MSKTESKQEFKAVEFQRKRRKELSELYIDAPAEFWKKLDSIKKKYSSKFRQRIKKTT